MTQLILAGPGRLIRHGINPRADAKIETGIIGGDKGSSGCLIVLFLLVAPVVGLALSWLE